MSASITLEDNLNVETNQQLETILEDVKKMILERQHVPTAAYRFQFNRFFTFQQARETVEYVKRLGVSDLYASPYFRARAESLHGYDVCNPNELNPTIGTEEDYNALVDELHRQGMYQLLDTVPNHMGIGEACNGWWMDVLENGRSSLYAPFFDIDWEPLNPKLTGKVLLPVLGDQYGRVLEKKELQLSFAAAEGTLYLNYYEVFFPINPRSYIPLLEFGREELLATLGAESDPALEYQSILTALNNLPRKYETERDRVLERNREKEIIKRRLTSLCQAEARVDASIQVSIAAFNGIVGDPHSFDRLDSLLEEQAYRLSFWRVAAEEINYRRFFDVNELAAIRVDQPEVFAETHRTIFRFLREGKLDGLRIDHVDGLRNPAAYFVNLQRGYFLELCRLRLDELEVPTEERAALEAQLSERFETERALVPTGPFGHPLYVLVEKILGRGESLPSDWAVCGTTGYEYTNAVNGLFVDGANAKAFDEIYSSFIGEKTRFSELVYETKKGIMRLSLASEITILTNLLNQVSQHDRHYRDFTLSTLRNAIREVVASFPVYRTYVTRQHEEVDRRDQDVVKTAIARAKKRNPALDPTVFDFMGDILLLKYTEDLDEANISARYNFVMKFQQCTGPLMAKGLEDTAFYIYNRLISLNEVGGEPEHFGNTLVNFHRQQAERQRNWPYSLLTTSTHDTKRSEDVRARIDGLSEMPKEWKTALARWARYNKKHKTKVDDKIAPDRNEEYFLYQTLLGVWPFMPGDRNLHDLDQAEYQKLIERVQAYMRKAMNEAKVNTSWVNPNEAYGEAVTKFVERILDRQSPNRFLDEFIPFQKRLAGMGIFNSLSQVLLKLTSPGVPDIYQGNELWDLSLVDPDNRRPVDYAWRSRLLTEVAEINDAAGAAALLNTKEDGRIKLYLTSRTLGFRQEHKRLFRQGTYTALEAVGPRQENLCAFARSHGQESAVVVVPRLVARLGPAPVGPVWAGTYLALPEASVGQTYRNVLTNETILVEEHNGITGLPLDKVLAVFPVALLEKE